MTVCIIYIYVKEHINQYKIECPKKKRKQGKDIGAGYNKGLFSRIEEHKSSDEKGLFHEKGIKKYTHSFIYI